MLAWLSVYPGVPGYQVHSVAHTPAGHPLNMRESDAYLIKNVFLAIVCRFGRHKFIVAAAALILVANVLQTAATGKVMLFAGRLIMGLGQGLATFTVPV